MKVSPWSLFQCGVEKKGSIAYGTNGTEVAQACRKCLAKQLLHATLPCATIKRWTPSNLIVLLGRQGRSITLGPIDDLEPFIFFHLFETSTRPGQAMSPVWICLNELVLRKAAQHVGIIQFVPYEKNLCAWCPGTMLIFSVMKSQTPHNFYIYIYNL